MRLLVSSLDVVDLSAPYVIGGSTRINVSLSKRVLKLLL